MEKLTFEKYSELLNQGGAKSVDYLRGHNMEQTLDLLKKKELLGEKIKEYVRREYPKVECKRGHLTFVKENNEKCHRYYYGKNEFYKLTCEDNTTILFHYNLQEEEDYKSEGVYINL